MIVVRRSEDDIKTLEGIQYESPRDKVIDWSGVVVKKPWGEEREIHRGGAISVWRLKLDDGAETSLHCHPNKFTALLVESGFCLVETMNAIYHLAPGDMVYLFPGVFHRTKAQRDCVILEIETPPHKLDLVRLEDKYQRGQGYEAC